jgi:hypothetical protein
MRQTFLCGVIANSGCVLRRKSRSLYSEILYFFCACFTAEMNRKGGQCDHAGMHLKIGPLTPPTLRSPVAINYVGWRL